MEYLMLVFLLLGPVAALYLLSRSKPRCPSCNRARVPGQERCPFCKTLYTTKAPTLPQETACLVCIEGPQKSRQFPIMSPNFTIGRSRENDLVVEGLLVSRQHAQITFEQGQYILYDRDSTNGTWVNGRRIAHRLLQPGDQIQIGPSVFIFQTAGAPASAPIVLTPEPVRVATPVPLRRGYEFEEYQLVETLGGGGAATVYRAVSRRSGTIVAIKILHQTDPYLLEKFEQEGRLGWLLQHPHIVRIYDHGQKDGRYYIVMEYVDQGSLRKKMTPGRSLPLDFVTTIVGQTCEALGYAHAQGVIHRDIKPENILLSSKEGVKIVDFGIAKLASAPKRTSDGMILGTPYYMSYEQAKGQAVYHHSDIYSLGVVLYEMVTGRVPFFGDALTVVHKHITEEPIPPRRINPTVPAHVEGVILRAMAKDYRRRFQSAEEMARALGYAPVAPPRLVKEKPPIAVQPVLSRVRPTAVAPSGEARLVVAATGRVIPVTADILLGRKTIDAEDMLISREHARIFRQGEQFWLMDYDSTNGTYLNGRRVFDRVLLQGGDEIRLGRTILKFEKMS